MKYSPYLNAVEAEDSTGGIHSSAYYRYEKDKLMLKASFEEPYMNEISYYSVDSAEANKSVFDMAAEK